MKSNKKLEKTATEKQCRLQQVEMCILCIQRIRKKCKP